jgi:hypothetical protein
MFPHQSDLRHQWMMHPCVSVVEHLQFGALSMGYDGLWPNRTGVNVLQHMTPTTVVELGEGVVIGLERTITSRSGHFTPPRAAEGRGYTQSTLFAFGTDCYLATATVGALAVDVEVEPGAVAIVVWG